MDRRWVRGGCLGKGSFGSVSLALDRAGARIFAVKSVNLNSAPPRVVAALENEIRLLRFLNSPHVVTYLGDDITEEPAIGGSCRNLHLEYLPGGTVADAASEATMGENDVRAYARSIVLGLHYLHSTAGVVHGDVKGRNALLGPAPGAVKLADFGLARRLSDEDDSDVRGKGTPLWMAPEVARGGVATPASDVWSLGCTVIEMASGGRQPWGEPGFGGDAAAQMFRVGFGVSVPEFPSSLSKAGQDFLDKCLRRDAGERWTCEKLLQHPFLADTLPETGPSPRSVLDWAELELEFDDQDDSDNGGDGNSKQNQDAVSTMARERLQQLASPAALAVNWSNEGWVAVRSVSEEEDESREGQGYCDCRGAARGERHVGASEAGGVGLSNGEMRGMRFSQNCLGCQVEGAIEVSVVRCFVCCCGALFLYLICCSQMLVNDLTWDFPTLFVSPVITLPDFLGDYHSS